MGRVVPSEGYGWQLDTEQNWQRHRAKELRWQRQLVHSALDSSDTSPDSAVPFHEPLVPQVL